MHKVGLEVPVSVIGEVEVPSDTVVSRVQAFVAVIVTPYTPPGMWVSAAVFCPPGLQMMVSGELVPSTKAMIEPSLAPHSGSVVMNSTARTEIWTVVVDGALQGPLTVSVTK